MLFFLPHRKVILHRDFMELDQRVKQWTQCLKTKDSDFRSRIHPTVLPALIISQFLIMAHFKDYNIFFSLCNASLKLLLLLECPS